MDQTEIKELYAEELTLLKRIQRYGKEQKPDARDRIERVTLLLLYRIYSNIYSALLLTASGHKSGKFSFFQLPIGIILRCAFTDCMFALYIQRIGGKLACEELEMRAIEYANSLLERKEVYRDQVKSSGMNFDSDFIDHMWELTMEDNFLHLLAVDENNKAIEVTKRSKDQLKNAGFSKTKSIGIKEQKDYLIKQEGLKTVVTRLYHYYKYFSQYEHFSENGQGDVLVSSEEVGNDNIHLPSAIKALGAGVEAVINMRKGRV